MERTSLRALAAVLAALALPLADGGARAAMAPRQSFDPAKCQYDDKECITGWYKEYVAGILGEFKYYSGQQDFVTRMLAQPNETLINSRLSLLMIEGGMRFDQWVALKDDEAAKLAGLDMVKYATISGECRDAVGQMRGAVFDLRQHRDKVPADMAKYLKDAKICQKVFAIPAPRPAPAGGQGADDGDSPAGPAPPLGPLVITPTKKPAR